ncbi:MAG: magnesium transporter [Deltaproteobacteria bacterium]|nr:magnesium transporter [Deltaproteobacteria bacterium]
MVNPQRATTDRDCAAQHLLASVATARAGETAGGALDRLERAPPALLDPVFVLDDRDGLVGICSLGRVMAADRAARCDVLMAPVAVSVLPSDDQEHVALLAIQHRTSTVPVVSVDGKFMGVVPPAALFDILYHEHTEDLHRLAGISREVVRAQAAIEAPPVRRARDRLPWLLVGLAGSSLATLVMAAFERVIAERVAIAFFVPAIVYLADAMGTQTEAVAVRGLSLSRASIWHLLRGEVWTGLIIGSALALIALVLVGIGFHDFRLGLTVALSVLSAGAVAASLGLALPWVLSRAGIDPAFGSGPLATIIQDVVSIGIYFGMVTLLL